MIDNPAFVFLVVIVVLVVLGLLFKVREGGEGSWGDKSFKAGSIVALGVFAVVALAFIFNDNESSEDPIEDGTSVPEDGTSVPEACTVQGVVTNEDTNTPLQNSEIGIVPFGSTFTQEEGFTFKANLAANGFYRFSCTDTPPGSTIAIMDAGWGGCVFVSGYRVPASGETTDANLAVSYKVMELLGDLYGLPKNDNCEMFTGEAGPP